MEAFQAQELEIHEKMESTQLYIFTKVEAIQKCYQVVDLSLNNIYIKEREANATCAKFQEAILIATKDDIAEVP
jgi:hypothetical protein